MSDARPDTIVLVHGFWVTPRSWEGWIEHYEAKGYRVLAPAYPGFEVEVEALNADPTPIEQVTIPRIIEHLESIIDGLDRAPILIGHSAGGALVQVLLDHGRGCVGVAMCSAPTEGVTVAPISQLRSTFPVFRNPANRHRAVGLDFDEWRYAFTNTFPEDEARRLYERYHIPAAGNIVWGGVLANLIPGHQDVWVDYHNDARPPLLFISASEDHIMPPRVQRSNAKHLAGGLPARAQALLDAPDVRFRDPRRRALAMRLEGLIEVASGDMPRAITSLMRAADAIAAFDVPLARTTLLHAAAAARFAGRFARPGGRDVDIAAAARRLPAGPEPAPPDLLLDAYATLHLDGGALAMPVLRRGLAALAGADASSEEPLLWFGVGSWVASTVADGDALHLLSHRAVDAAREQGALGHLANGLLYRAMSNLLGGSLRGARSDFTERAELLEALGVTVDVGRMVMAAWSGEEAEARAEMEVVHRYAVDHELGWMLAFTDYSRAILEIGLGNYDAALAGTSREYVDDSFLVIVGFPNVIEALARSGRLEEARAAHAVFAERATSIGGTIAPGLLARTEALLADDDRAEGHHLEALALLQGSGAELQLARAHLLYGEWLRRQRRTTEARDQLRTAHGSFVERGVGAFARRARIELEAAGEHMGPAPLPPSTVLTAQEAQIARLAAEGLTNHEIAAKLFLSASTVDYHLRKVFRKLGISSRRRLREALR